MSAETLLQCQLPVSILSSQTGFSPSSALPRASTSLQTRIVYSSVQNTLTLTVSDLSTRLLLLQNVLTQQTYEPIRDAQFLRIDFTAFRGHLVDLVQKPLLSEDFVAVLVLPEHQQETITFRIIELNAYKAINHLELQLQQASQQQLVTALAEKAREADAANAQVAQLTKVVEERENKILEMKNEIEHLGVQATQLTIEREQNLNLRSNRDQDSRIIADLRQVIEGKDRQLSESSRQLNDLQPYVEQVEELKTQLAAEREEHRSREMTNLEVNSRVEEAVRERDRLQDEIKKANEQIERLQSEVRSLRAKGKVKSAIITKQETAVEAQEARIATLERDIRRVRDRAAMLEVEKEGLSGRLSSACSKLEENAAVLASDQQVIAYLNRELNNRIIASDTILNSPPRQDEPRSHLPASGSRTASPRETEDVSMAGASFPEVVT